MSENEERKYDTSKKEDWLELHLRSLPSEIKDSLGLKDLKECSEEEKELFKAVLKEAIKRKYETYDEWNEN